MDPEQPDEEERRGNLFALEVAFLAIVAIVTAIAFLEALSYQIVSSRTPFVIMAPLAVLVVIHGIRLWRVRAPFSPRRRIGKALSGRLPSFNAVVAISGWMLGLVAMIWVFGHYAAIFLFCYFLMGLLAGERMALTLAVSAATTALIFVVFEWAFDIELYRGLIVRYFLGFRDF